MTSEIRLRAVEQSDLPIFFEHQQDAAAVEMAAFTHEDPSDRAAFDAHWNRILADPTVLAKTVLADGQVAGHISKWERDGKPELTYWIAREHWGKGVATEALVQLLRLFTARPIYAAAARDNLASLRVLAKCGFRVIASERGFANARGQEIDEVILELSEPELPSA